MNIGGNKQLGVFLVIISTFGFALYPILGKLVFAGGAGLSTVLFVRFALAAIIFWVIALARGGFPKLPLKTWLILWALGGICYASQAGLYLTAIQYISPSLAALLLYIHPLLVMLISVMTGQERFQQSKVMGLLLSAAGLVLVLGISLGNVRIEGVLGAIGAALVYSVYLVVSSRVLKTVDLFASTAMISSSAALTYGIFGAISGYTWAISSGTWLGIFGISLASSVVAMLTLFAGMKRIGPTSSSIISMLEPVLTVILAYAFFRENFSLPQGIGGLLILLGGLLAVWSPKRKTMVINQEATR